MDGTGDPAKEVMKKDQQDNDHFKKAGSILVSITAVSYLKQYSIGLVIPTSKFICEQSKQYFTAGR